MLNCLTRTLGTRGCLIVLRQSTFVATRSGSARQARVPRNARIIITGTFVHLISRFVDGRFVFDDEARSEYLFRLGRALASSDWVLVSYALMSSHIHLGLIAGVIRLKEWLQPAHTAAAQWVNRRSRGAAPKTLGHVFADRPDTECYALSDAGSIIAYHHNNPVSAKVVTTAAESNWTSHRAYLGRDPQPPYLDVKRGLILSGCSPDAVGRREFDRTVRRRVTRDLGSIEPIEAPPEETPSSEPPSAALIQAPPPPDRVVHAAALAVGIPLTAVYSRARGDNVVQVRRLAVLAWWKLGGRSLDMARELGLAPSSVSRLRQRAQGVPVGVVEAVVADALRAA